VLKAGTQSYHFPYRMSGSFAVQHRHLFGHVAFAGYRIGGNCLFDLREILCREDEIESSQGFSHTVPSAGTYQGHDILPRWSVPAGSQNLNSDLEVQNTR
jgi:hypothetical protein